VLQHVESCLAGLLRVADRVVQEQFNSSGADVGRIAWGSVSLHWPMAGAQSSFPYAQSPRVVSAFHHDFPAAQEFALGRAIAQRPRRRGAAVADVPLAPSVGTSSEELAMFVQQFKDMASNLDEVCPSAATSTRSALILACRLIACRNVCLQAGAKNLLMWSPLFMPSMQGLMQAQPDARLRPSSGRRRTQEAVAELQRSADGAATLNSDAAVPGRSKPAGRPRPPKVNSVAVQRDARVHKLQQMYGCGGGDADGTAGVAANGVASAMGSGGGVGGGGALPPRAAAATSPYWDSSQHPRSPYSTRVSGTASAAGLTPARGGGSPGNDDDWENEVDGLLEWTTGLQVPSSPG
jgi:hypothetical protein